MGMSLFSSSFGDYTNNIEMLCCFLIVYMNEVVFTAQHLTLFGKSYYYFDTQRILT